MQPCQQEDRITKIEGAVGRVEESLGMTSITASPACGLCGGEARNMIEITRLYYTEREGARASLPNWKWCKS